MTEAPPAAESILRAPTPAAWVEAALERWRELLVDHANCEKKAASTALGLLFAYPEDSSLCFALARLAREELRHFEQVARLMRELGIPYLRVSPGRYANRLRAALRHAEPGRKLDVLLTGALIEARSCERFGLLAAELPAPAAELYRTLEASEARHGQLYLEFARREALATELGAPEFSGRLRQLATLEAELATAPDAEFRFHSGPPAATPARD